MEKADVIIPDKNIAIASGLDPQHCKKLYYPDWELILATFADDDNDDYDDPEQLGSEKV